MTGVDSVALGSTWVAFFATSVYGHVALKLAVDSRPNVTLAMLSPWGISALLAWAVSSVLWMFVLAGHTLFAANSIGALRSVFVCVAAWALLRRPLSFAEFAGSVLIVAGVYLVGR